MSYIKRFMVVFALLAILAAVVGVAAQTGYGTTSPTPPSCGTGSFYDELSEGDAQEFFAGKDAVFDFSNLDLVTVFYTRCFGNIIRTLTSFQERYPDFTCENAVVYKVDANGNIGVWPYTCDANTDVFTILGTGLPGHIMIFAQQNESINPIPVFTFSDSL